MMGWREKLVGGAEWDYLTGWRKWYHHDKGRSHDAKTKFQRRIRRKYKQKLTRVEMSDDWT